MTTRRPIQQSSLAVMTTLHAGPVPAAELGLPDDQEAVLSSRLVIRAGSTLAFPLPVIEQWFAAQALLDGSVDLEPMVGDLDKLEPWRYPLVIAVGIGAHDRVTRLLSPLAREHPGLTGWIVHEALDTSPWVHEPIPRPPPAVESARRVRETAQAWVVGLGPLAGALVPLTTTGHLPPIGAAVMDRTLITAWYGGPAQLPEAVELPHDAIVPHRGSLWSTPQSGTPAAASAWAWEWSLRSPIRHLEKLLRDRRFPPRPGGVIHLESRWRLANAIVAAGSLTHRPLEVGRIIAAVRARMGRRPSDSRTRLFGLGRGVWATEQELHDLIADLEKLDTSLLERPWQAPDRPSYSPVMAWDFYSPEALRHLTEQVYQGALDAYAELVEGWFPRWRYTLGLAAMMPVKLQGYLSSASGDRSEDEPGLVWFALPALDRSSNLAQVELDTPLPDWDTVRELERRARSELQLRRPYALPYAEFAHHDSALDIFGMRPATTLAYRWLSADLWNLHWLKLRPVLSDN